MSAPPQFVPTPPKSKTGLWIGLIIGGAAVCCIGPMLLLAGGGWFAFKTGKGSIECMVNFSVVQKALRHYVKDHNGKLPSAEKWQDELRPYVENSASRYEAKSGPFKMFDPNGDWGCVDGDNTTGMSFNRDFSGKNVKEIKDQMAAIVVFEIEKPAKNANQPYKPLDFEKSPKLFTMHRGWLAIPLTGKPLASDRNGSLKPMGTNMSDISKEPTKSKSDDDSDVKINL